MNTQEEDRIVAATEPVELLRAIEPRHHERIERLLGELRHEAYGEDPRALCAAWARLDRELQAHLCDEESYILPEFARAHPDDARAILADHAELRRLVAAIGVDVELHAVRAPTIEELAERLQQHARREDAVMYPWAMSHLV
jgi:iron-sulfur cluster repair protein YtfE (RIC family)